MHRFYRICCPFFSEGNTAFAAKDYDVAIAKYTEAIGIDGTNHVYYSNRRCVYIARALDFHVHGPLPAR